MGKIKSQQNNMNLNFIDEFDLEKVKMLYCMSNEELLLCTNYKDYSQEDNNKYVNNIKSSLKKLILNDSNKINRIYQKKNCNRIYCCEYGLQYFSNNILHFILPNNTVEYDIKNSQPSIMLYLFKKHNLPHSELSKYVENRDSLLSRAGLKKTDITKLMNQDKTKLDNKPDWLKLLIEEYNSNKPILMGLEDDKLNRSYKEDKKKSSKNFISSMCCSIYYYYECEILLKAVNNYKCIIPKYDGFLSDENINIDDLNKLSCDYGVFWDKKIASSPIQSKTYDPEILNNLLYPALVYPTHFETVLKLAELIKTEINKSLVFSNNKWFGYNGKLWVEYKSPLYNISKFINCELDKSLKLRLDEIKNDKDFDTLKEEVKKTWTGCRKMLDTSSYKNGLIENFKTLLIDNDFILKLDKTPEKFVFNNGIYDIRNKTFTLGINKEDLISKTLPFDYEPNINQDNRKWILDQLLKICNMNHKHLEYYLSVISFCLLGVPEMQQEIYCLIGQGASNGKTIALEALMNIFKIYITKGETKLFESDCNKKHKFLEDYIIGTTRLVIHNEMDDKKEVDSKMFKEIADGESIKNEIMFGTSDDYKINAKPVILGNYTLKFDKMDKGVERRYKHLQFNTKFYDDDELEEEDSHKLKFFKDKKFKNKLIEKKNEFIDIIIEYGFKYLQKESLPKIPDDFKHAQEEALCANNEFKEWFDSLDILEGDDYECSSIKLLNMYNIYATDNTLDKINKNRTLVDKLKPLGYKYNKDKMIDKKKGVFIGFKLISELEEDDKNKLIIDSDSD